MFVVVEIYFGTKGFKLWRRYEKIGNLSSEAFLVVASREAKVVAIVVLTEVKFYFLIAICPKSWLFCPGCFLVFRVVEGKPFVMAFASSSRALITSAISFSLFSISESFTPINLFYVWVNTGYACDNCTWSGCLLAIGSGGLWSFCDCLRFGLLAIWSRLTLSDTLPFLSISDCSVPALEFLLLNQFKIQGSY